jgi:uncharacterized membrane protein
MKKQYIIIAVLILFAAIVTAFVYPQLPETVASHWNAEGVVDGYMDKKSNTLFFFGLMIGIPLLMLYLPKIDPKYQNIKAFEGSFDWFIVGLSVFFIALYVFSLAWALGYQFPINYFIIPALSLLFFSIGKMLENAKMNYTIGIRTPWTLANEENWDKTHKLSAKTYQYGSLFLLVALLFGKYSFVIFIISLLAMTLYPVLYSFILYKKQEKKGNK